MKFRYRDEEEMKDSVVGWIGKIPSDWETIKGKYLFENNKLKNTGNIKNVLSLTLNGVIDRDINNFEGLQPDSFDGYQEFNKDNLVFKLIDLENISTSRVGYVHKDGLMSPAYIRLRKKKNIDSKDYYYNYFDYYNQNIFNFLGSVGVRSALNSTDLLEMDIISTTKFQQDKIAKFLDGKIEQFNCIISKKEDLIKRLEEAKKSLISEVVTGKVKVVKTQNGYELVERKKEEMKDSGVEWIQEIPINWRMPSLSKCTVLGSGGTPNRNILEYWNKGEIPWMSSGEVNREYIVDTIEKITELGMSNSNAKLLPKNTVMLGLIGQGKTKGKTAILEVEATCNQNLAYLIANQKILDYKYLFYCMKSMYTYLRGIVGESQAGIYLTLLRTLKIPLPSVEDQKHFVDYIDMKIKSFNDSIIKTKIQITKIKEAKQSLISEAVTGKIEILD